MQKTVTLAYSSACSHAACKASQKGAFKVLDNAKRCADENVGYSVFDEGGKAVYTGKAAYATYTVKKGDSL